ncbi:DUF3836 domain-containing protein [Parabacteroides sp. ZJ-118]|uniref:DUF3836 domain-containing protein n=1 Tax=Parabacteroides sp. ZJ-118 TaxID=2709398 RepID=UPI0013EE1844|nr:DUF3836 domain-containing protein [Parabacteroides sp. ZJ-118]
MKTLVRSKSILTLVFMFMCSLAVSAVSPKDYLYDTKEENGKIVSKVVFLQENGLLSKQVRYEFQYNENGKVSEKKAFRWDRANDEWVPFYQITYQYDDQSGEIKTSYGMWDKKKKDFSLNVQNMVIPSVNYEEIFS